MARSVAVVGITYRLGERIRRLRAAYGWSQEVLAELSGLHRNYVGHLERAEVNPGLVNVEKIAQAFDMAVHDMLNMDTLDDLARAEKPVRPVYTLDGVEYRVSPRWFISRRHVHREK